MNLIKAILKEFIEVPNGVKDLEEEELWGVSGATRTSNCISWTLVEESKRRQKIQHTTAFSLQFNHILMLIVLGLALAAPTECGPWPCLAPHCLY